MKAVWVSYFILASNGMFCVAQESIGKLPLNPAVRYGKLENGFQYYIVRNNFPQGKVSMSLVVDAGFPDEEADELAVAHLVEHLAFYATTNFPKGVREFLRGADISSGAHTSDETTYDLEMSSRDPEILKSSMLILHDWAGSMSFRKDDIDQERSAVLREQSRADNKIFAAFRNERYLLLDKNPKYAPSLEREIQNITTVSAQTILNFYKKWYHPIYQTVFIVGDIRESEVEEMVKFYFSDLSNDGYRQKKDNKNSYTVPLTGKSKFVVVEHGKEMQPIRIDVFKKGRTILNHDVLGTLKEYKINLMDKLIQEMMDHRLDEKRKYEDSYSQVPLFAITRNAIANRAGIDAMLLRKSVNTVDAVKHETVRLIAELRQLGRYGFVDAEFDRASKMLQGTIAKPSNLSSSEILLRLNAHHFRGTSFPKEECDLIKSVLDKITLREINEMITSWLVSRDNIDVLISVPDSSATTLPSESEVLTWINEGYRRKTSPYVESNARTLPMLPLGNPASHMIREMPEMGATRIEFPNGIKIVLKPFPLNSHNLLTLKGVKSNSDSWLDGLTIPFNDFVGILSLTATDINKIIATQPGLWVTPYISEGECVIQGEARLDQTESLFHLAHLYMAKGIADHFAFKRYCEETERVFETPADRSGKFILADSIGKTIGWNPQKTIGRQPLVYSKELADRIFENYRNQFGDAAGFTFVITGSFDKVEMISLVKKYFGTLPGMSRPSQNVTLVNLVPNRFKGDLKTILVGDSVNNVDVRVLFEGYYKSDVKNALTLAVLTKSLDIILFKRLREREKGVYAVNTDLRVLSSIRDRFYLDVSFETAPADVDRLTNAVKEELNLLATGVLDVNVFTNSVNDLRRELIGAMNSSYFWVDILLKYEQQGGQVVTDEVRKIDILDSITPTNVTDAVRDFLNTKKCMLFKLL